MFIEITLKTKRTAGTTRNHQPRMATWRLGVQLVWQRDAKKRKKARRYACKNGV